ncbi:MAG TPA: hypothetical protein VGO76_19060 [Luteibacter sp.]|nr:hypothetical protein [Luteibacter sp.]
MASEDGGTGGKRSSTGPMAPVTAPPRTSRAFMYTPFGGEHALNAAFGENMVRLRKGKEPHALLAPSADEANRMEAKKTQLLSKWKGTIDSANETLRGHHGRVTSAGYTNKMRMRSIAHDVSLNPIQRKQAMATQKEAHQEIREDLKFSKFVAETERDLHGPNYQALEQTHIANATVRGVRDSAPHPQWPNLFPGTRMIPNIYPSLHAGQPLQNIVHKDKLYVIGHGAPASADLPRPGLYATPSTSGPSLSPGALAQHLSDAGLPKDFRDLRLTSCQAVPMLETNGPHAVAATRDSGFLAPELSKAVKPHFPNLSVTGYMGDGVTFPIGSDHHQRAMPGEPLTRAPRKELAVKFPPL